MPPLTPSLRMSIIDGLFWCLMVGLGESYISAYAVRLEGSPLFLGVLASVPPLLGAWAQILGVWLIRKVTSRKKLIVTCALLQSLTWIPILSVSLLPFDRSTLHGVLLVSVIFYHVLGNLGSPAWNGLIGDLVPENQRGSFFGFRNAVMNLGTLVSLFVAGIVLYLFQQYSVGLNGYLFLFGIAGFCRLLSSFYLSKYEDIPAIIDKKDWFSFWEFIKVSPRSNFARFVWCYSLMLGAVNLAAPIIPILLLREFHFSYIQYASILGTQILFQFLTMHRWGALSDHYGNKRILTVCGFAISIIPFLWMISSDFWYLLAIHTWGGIFWAGYSQGAANFLFDAVSPPKRSRCFAYQAVISATIVCVASTVCGYLATHHPDILFIERGVFTQSSLLYTFFLFSALGRLAVAFLSVRLFKEVKNVKKISHQNLVFQVVRVRFGSAAEMRPIDT